MYFGIFFYIKMNNIIKIIDNYFINEYNPLNIKLLGGKDPGC